MVFCSKPIFLESHGNFKEISIKAEQELVDNYTHSFKCGKAALSKLSKNCCM